MKYIITEQQYTLIYEALGVPESILESAEEFYNIFLEHIESIKDKRDEYNFDGDVDITLGGRKKINIDSYSVKLEVNEFEEYDESPKVISMGMSQDFAFDRELMMKRVSPSTKAEFSITYVANPNWEPSEIYEEFLENKVEHVSSLAHEIKHKYDKQSKQVDLIGLDAKYLGSQRSPRFGIPVIDIEFLHYLYYTTVAENLVRTTEVASELRSRKITQDEFRKFLENDRTFKTLVEIKNFTFNDIIKGISDNMNQVDEIIKSIGKYPEVMTDNEKIDLILNLVYINVASTTLQLFSKFTQGPNNELARLFKLFGGNVVQDEDNVIKLRNKFEKYVRRYDDNHIGFFKDEIENFHKVADQMIKKLAKLYAMTPKENTNESIIDWELHMKLMDKKYGQPKIEKSFK